jgi:hypothetical protein
VCSKTDRGNEGSDVGLHVDMRYLEAQPGVNRRVFGGVRGNDIWFFLSWVDSIPHYTRDLPTVCVTLDFHRHTFSGINRGEGIAPGPPPGVD